jgi:hypothetical protein
MTTIVYRAPFLVGDRCCSHNGSRHYDQQKIFRRHDGALIGIAGNGNLAARWRNWWMDGEPEGKEPARAFGDGDDYSIGGFIIRRDGAVIQFDRFGEDEVTGPYFAIGSGSEVALGALAMGATAKQAVEICVRYDVFSGGVPDILEHKPRAIRRVSAAARIKFSEQQRR